MASLLFLFYLGPMVLKVLCSLLAVPEITLFWTEIAVLFV